MTPALAIVLKGYPRLSESFIAQELRALERRGFSLRLISLRRPTEAAIHPVHREITAPVRYLPEYLHEAPGRVFAAWRKARRLPGYRAARRLWLRDLRRDPSRSRLRRFGQALVLAAEAEPEIGAFYAHFLHTPASVARYAAALTGLPWAVSAHAKDIWTTPARELAEKLADCAWATTCTAEGQRFLAALAPPGKRIHLAYHGLDPARFPPPPARLPEAGAPIIILSIGRAVAKKGYPDLLDALAALPPDLDWRFIHLGGGDRAALEGQAAALGLSARIEWRGPATQDQVLAACRAADLFVLASRIAPDGDRDGLPNVLMEAQSQGLACLSTKAAAVAELIETEVTGLLVEPGDVAALAAGLARLIRDPALRQRLGGAGQQRVAERFGTGPGIAEIAEALWTLLSTRR